MHHRILSKIDFRRLFPGDKRWRVDWYGQVGFPDRLRNAYQPSIELHVSRIDSVTASAPSFVTLGNRLIESHKISLRIGYLPYVPIGSYWERGEKLPVSDGVVTIFSEVVVGPGTTDFIRAGQADDGFEKSAFYLPVHEHPWHMGSTQSWCVKVELPNGQRLVIPCVELLRFYFGSSSGLLSRLFRIPLVRESLYRESETTWHHGSVKLMLAGGISGASAADIARIALSKSAWIAANQVGDSVLKARSAGKTPYVRCGFPFQGMTDLRVRGKWVSFNGEPQKTFVVHAILGCTHPFPFREITYRMPWQTTRPSADTTCSSDGAPRKYSILRKRLKWLSFFQCDPSGTTAPRGIGFDEEERFPDLRFKRIRKEAVDRGNEPGKYSLGAAAPEGFAVGEEGNNKGVASADLVPIKNKPGDIRADPPDFLKAIIKYLQSVPGIAVEVHTFSGGDAWSTPVPVIADVEGEITPACFQHQAGSLKHALRRYAVLELRGGSLKGMVIAVQAQQDAGAAITLISPISMSDIMLLAHSFTRDLIETNESGSNWTQTDMKDVAQLASHLVS